MEEFEGRRRRGMQTTGEWCNRQQHAAPCVRGVEYGLGTKSLRILLITATKMRPITRLVIILLVIKKLHKKKL